MQGLHTSSLVLSLCVMFYTVTSQQKADQMVGFDGGYGNRYKAASEYGAQRAAYDRVADFRSPGKRQGPDAGYGSRFKTAAMLARDRILNKALMRTQDFKSPGKRSKMFREWEV